MVGVELIYVMSGEMMLLHLGIGRFYMDMQMICQ